MIVSGLIGQSGIFPENHLIVTEIDDRSGVGVFLKSLLSAFVAGGRGLAKMEILERYGVTIIVQSMWAGFIISPPP